MVAARQLLNEPAVQWLSATPLWEPYNAIGQRQQVRRPEILRFASDTFMEDFITVATNAPERLGEWHATRETWRKPAPIPPLRRQPNTLSAAQVLDGATEDPDLAGEPLKLFMPAHQRYYLVTANLVCRIPGLPDKMLNFSTGEQATFVMRRILRGQEHALVGGLWQPVDEETTLVAGEEQHPLFPVTYQEFEGYPRRIFAGLVPVSKREALMTAGRRTAPALTSGTAAGTATERVEQLLTVLDMDVLQPWREVKRHSRRAAVSILQSLDEDNDDAPFDDIKDYTRAQRDLLQVSSWYVLLDFAKYLQTYLPTVWADLSKSTSSLTGAQRVLWQRLRSTLYSLDGGKDSSVTSRAHVRVDAFIKESVEKLKEPDQPDPYLEEYLRIINTTSGQANLAERLGQILAAEQMLDTVLVEYPKSSSSWPSQRFLVSSPEFAALVPADPSEEDSNQPTLETLVRNALAVTIDSVQTRIPLIPLAAQLSKTIAQGDYDNDTFVIRCVFERPNCPPGLRPTVVSAPTQAFRLASYFDPDAPARPFRIPMPIDTTPAGLRKHARNTMFVLSDTLACQIEKARTITFGDLVLSVLPWPFHKDLPDMTIEGCEPGLGMLCTLSIPIITICALILLILFVLVLDIIFHWIPFLIFCLPLPGLKAKD